MSDRDYSVGVTAKSIKETGQSYPTRPNDAREIIINISDKSATFREFLYKKKGISGMNVNPKVRLYSDKGFKVSQGFEEDHPYTFLTDLFSKGSAFKKGSIVAKAVSGAYRVAGGAKSIATVASSDNDGIAWTPWLKNILSFKGADAYTVDVEFKFNMGQYGLWNAREEVFVPIMNLMALFLPLSISGVNIVPHLRTSTQALYDFLRELFDSGNVAEALDVFKSVGSSFTAEMKKGEGIKDLPNSIDAALDELFTGLSSGISKLTMDAIENKPGHFYNVDIGYSKGSYLFRRLQPTSCNIEFTNKEYDDNGFPVEGSISMKFQSYQPATVEGIYENKINFGFIRS